MAVFAKMLIAQRAFIEELESQLIQVKAAIFGGKRFVIKNGQVADQGSHLPGFCLDKDGKLRASDAEISGHIEAASGTFKGRLEANKGYFIGELTAGALRSNTQPLFSVQRNFSSGTSYNVILQSEFNFWNKVLSDYATFTKSIEGAYGSQNIISVTFRNSGRNLYPNYGVQLQYADGAYSAWIYTLTIYHLDIKQAAGLYQ
jgi:predicted phage tail protein